MFTLYTSVDQFDRSSSCRAVRVIMELKQTTLFGIVTGASTDCMYANAKSKYERFTERWYQRHKGTRLKQELVKEAQVI